MKYDIFLFYFLPSTSVLTRDTQNRKQKHDLYAAMTYIGIKANSYKILTITSTTENHAVSAKMKWTIIMTMLGGNAYGKEASNMQLGRGCIIYLIIFF